MTAEEDRVYRETSRRLDEVTSRLETLAGRMESNYVRFDLFEAAEKLSETEHKALSQRISKLESRQEWLVRTVGAIIVTAVLAVIIATTRTGAVHGG